MTALAGVTKIVVLRPSAVGDFVFALPALRALKQTYPEARLVYLGLRWHADFLRGRPGPVDRVAVLPPCPGIGAPPGLQPGRRLRRLVDTLRAGRFDLAVQMYGGGRYANPFVARLGARLSVGMKAADAAPLDRWVAYDGLHNRRLQLLEVAALAGARAWQMEPELAVTPGDRQQAAQALPAQPGQRLVLLQPGASDARRRWPAARFAALADALAQQGALVAVHGTRQEAPLVRAVLAAMRAPAFDLSGKVSLSGLCGLLERCALLVSNDTGPLHLALAIGTPCVGIYWLSNLIESGPLRQHLHRPALSVRVHCPQCGAENLSTRCAHDVSFVADVPLEQVYALAQDLLRQGAAH